MRHLWSHDPLFLTALLGGIGKRVAHDVSRRGILVGHDAAGGAEEYTSLVWIECRKLHEQVGRDVLHGAANLVPALSDPGKVPFFAFYLLTYNGFEVACMCSAEPE